MGAEGKYDLELSEDPAPSPVPTPGEGEGEEDKESEEPPVELDEVSERVILDTTWQSKHQLFLRPTWSKFI